MIEKAKLMREELKKIEEEFCYEKIASFWQIANKKHKIKIRKLWDQEEHLKRLTELERSKVVGLKWWFGFGKTEDEEEKDW